MSWQKTWLDKQEEGLPGVAYLASGKSGVRNGRYSRCGPVIIYRDATGAIEEVADEAQLARFSGEVIIRTAMTSEGVPAALAPNQEPQTLVALNGSSEALLTSHGVRLATGYGDILTGKIRMGRTTCVAALDFRDMDEITLASETGLGGPKLRVLSFARERPPAEIEFRVRDFEIRELPREKRIRSAAPLGLLAVNAAVDAIQSGVGGRHVWNRQAHPEVASASKSWEVAAAGGRGPDLVAKLFSTT